MLMKGIKKIRNAANCTELCVPVRYIAFVNTSEIKVCTSFDQHFCGLYLDYFREQINICKKQEGVEKYFIGMVNFEEDYVPTEDHFNDEEEKRFLMLLFWRYQSNITAVLEEKLVYSPKDLLAWLGGALGIFVGYSLFDLAKHIIDIAFYFVQKAISKTGRF